MRYSRSFSVDLLEQDGTKPDNLGQDVGQARTMERRGLTLELLPLDVRTFALPHAPYRHVLAALSYALAPYTALRATALAIAIQMQAYYCNLQLRSQFSFAYNCRGACDPFVCLPLAHKYIGWSDVTESMVKVRSPFCGYNTT